jgi:hypothetical protein
MSWSAKVYVGNESELEEIELGTDEQYLNDRAREQFEEVKSAIYHLLPRLFEDQYISISASGHAAEESAPGDSIYIAISTTTKENVEKFLQQES